VRICLWELGLMDSVHPLMAYEYGNSSGMIMTRENITTDRKT
jgi:hypothetical protein